MKVKISDGKLGMRDEIGIQIFKKFQKQILIKANHWRINTGAEENVTTRREDNFWKIAAQFRSMILWTGSGYDLM